MPFIRVYAFTVLPLVNYTDIVAMAEHTVHSPKKLTIPQSPSNPTEVKTSSPKSDIKHSPKSDSKSSSRSYSPTPKKPNTLPNTSGRLFKVFTRRSSLTLTSSSPKSTANLVGSKPLKKKVSLPGFDSVPSVSLNGTVQLNKTTGCMALNYQRPLPPSPPPVSDTLCSTVPNSDTCFPLEEDENSAVAAESEETLNVEIASSSDDTTTTCSSNSISQAENIDGQMRATLLNHELAGQTTPIEARETKTPIHTQSEYQQVETGGILDPSLKMERTAANCKSSLVSLNKALNEYDHKFPLRLQFMEGYCSEDSEHNLSTNDVYDIHFVKQTRVIILKDNNGFMHRIPLASSMMFGLVYNPNNNLNEALTGHEFEYCSNIMAIDVMPRIVCATNQIESTDERQSITQNEIMIVKGVQKHKLRGKRSLKVYSLLTNTEKLLHEECHGKFTTKPSLIRLHLAQIFECFQKPFPTQAVVYVNRDCPDLSNHLNVPLSGVITLCDCTTEMSLVASPVSDNCSDNAQISLHLNDEMKQLEVKVISWSQDGKFHAEEDHHSPYVNVTELYDDVLVLQQNSNTDDTMYDDVIVEKQKVTSDEETYATVGSWKSTAPLTAHDQLRKSEQSVNTSVEVCTHGQFGEWTYDRYNTYIHVGLSLSAHALGVAVLACMCASLSVCPSVTCYHSKGDIIHFYTKTKGLSRFNSWIFEKPSVQKFGDIASFYGLSLTRGFSKNLPFKSSEILLVSTVRIALV